MTTNPETPNDAPIDAAPVGAPVDASILGDAAASGADAPIRRTWDGPALLALGVIAVWAVAAVLIASAG